jgi:selenide,water dikinase
MTTLNKAAAENMLAVGVNACKDITGFGLLGHAAEMVEGTEVGFIIEAGAVPIFPAAKALAEAGMVPGGTGRNRDFRKSMIDIDKKVPQYLQDILFDPQTSGGLLIAVPEKKALKLLNRLLQEGITGAAIIGEVAAENKGRIRVT